MKTKNQYIITKTGGLLNLSSLKNDLKWARKLEWKETRWKPKPALIEKNSGNSQIYKGQKYDSKFFNLVENGWEHDHCDICTERINEDDNIYESGHQIICKNCWLYFISPENIEVAIKNMKKVCI